MSTRRYTEEFKVEAVKQVIERDHSVKEVAKRLRVSPYSLYQWVKTCGSQTAERVEARSLVAENRQLKSELKRVTEQRDILKKATAYFAKVSG